MSVGRERGLFFVSFFLKKKIEGASCFGSFLKRTFRGVVMSLGNGPKDFYSSSFIYICIQMRG